MSIYVDPEEDYGSAEPEKVAGTTEEVTTELGELNTDSVDVEIDETDDDDLPIGGYEYRGSIYSIGEFFFE
ncbi:MAG TPA: hypothetical protein PLS49_03415 [Candidatus Woesebacteria bacterium]|nr:hypothetical protein [Candidatus Woesebacteria bacterium]